MPKTKTPDELSYEQAFQELEGLVASLESGDLPLEESLKLFERGRLLASRCSQLLEQAELRLRQLAPDDQGELTEADFELEE
ncbi:MAG TPA: exodeoxyribonuclease VII small subunit [Anaerolineales bacterium]|nr:exodeoxyribonuclease VII small subunit [Anaerolineales bacterium]